MKVAEQHSFCRILIIDDQNSIHDVFRTVLLRTPLNSGALNELESELFGKPAPAGIDEASIENTTHVLEFAHQGEEGFLKLRTAVERGEHFDLAFVDMQMPPGWNGIETIRQLWTLMPSLPVVVCTAYSEYSWIDICRLLGNTEQLNLLPKPFVCHEVQHIVNNIIRGGQLSGRDLVF